MSDAREIPFDLDDLELLRRAMRHLQDNFDDMTPAFQITWGFGVERVRELTEIVHRRSVPTNAGTLRLTRREMSDLGHAIFWAFDWYEEFWDKAGITEERIDVVNGRLDALYDRFFPSGVPR